MQALQLMHCSLLVWLNEGMLLDGNLAGVSFEGRWYAESPRMEKFGLQSAISPQGVLTKSHMMLCFASRKK